MNSETVVMCVVALILGMLLANMLKNVCGCKVVEGKTSCNKNDDCPGAFTCIDNKYCGIEAIEQAIDRQRVARFKKHIHHYDDQGRLADDDGNIICEDDDDCGHDVCNNEGVCSNNVCMYYGPSDCSAAKA